jgi:ATP-dependent helicase/nuclease subunit A
MADVCFTEEQLKVIYTRNRNLLVSAAAGSGKTAVLVERIISIITDEKNPVPLDRLLVVTFTNAAASEMRERIAKALEIKVYNEPTNKYLHRQLALLPNANILTIHAFCLRVIKENFNVIDIDPSFRIGDEIELTLLKNDVIKDLLEEEYGENNPDFINLVESYAGGKSDELLETLIKNMYQFSISSPFPNKWLDDQVNSLKITSLDDLNHTIWYQRFIVSTKERLDFMTKNLMMAKEICHESEGPIHYVEAIEIYVRQIELIQDSLKKDYSTTKEIFDNFKIPKLSAKRKGIDKALKEQAKSLIDATKDLLQKMKGTYFVYSYEEIIGDMSHVYGLMMTLKDLVKAFSLRFSEIKEEKNIIDFNDIEHLALNILVEEREGLGAVPTSIADEYMDYFEEVLIDEYQDSNLVQESILNAVSKVRVGKPNIFMVGDVKQSIYKFRMARPELFMEKYQTYSEEESLYQLICLHKNFRSRKQVIDSINYIFSGIMSKELGDVNYDESVALYLGANYETIETQDNHTELILIDKSSEADQKDLTNKEYEARAIGQRIKALINSDFQVYDKENGGYRAATYKDIVILLRTTSRWVEVFMKELTEMDIPVYSNTTTGYFSTLEIRTIMNLLKLIDNPRQDIPLASVLRSPIVGLTSEELAAIRICFEEVEYYEALIAYVEGAIDSELADKLQDFLTRLERWRELSVYTPVNELIYTIYEETNYYNYVLVMPRGKQRQGNLDMFIDKAIAFEKTSYSGLFNFIRYVENIERYAIDLGEAAIFSENDNLVRIMSIHKSKGLEFPIVFVAGLSKQFNMSDLKASVVFHQELGIGANYINYIDRYKVTTLQKLAIIDQLKTETLSEELRILYVALTRAREKLILVGTIEGIEKCAIKWCDRIYHSQGRLNKMALESASHYLDLMMPWIIRHEDAQVIRNYINEDVMMPEMNFSSNEGMDITVISIDDIAKVEADVAGTDSIKALLDSWKEGALNLEDERIKLLSWQYPYDYLVHQKVSLSVSDIKRMHQEETMFEGQVRTVQPEFLENEAALTSAQKGTVFHKVMALINIKMVADIKLVNDFLENLVSKNILTLKEKESVNPGQIVRFLDSHLCERMREAGNRFRRETPFVLGIDINEIEQIRDYHLDDQVMIQGVIDAFFEEDDQLVLVDYKTDYIVSGGEKLLKDRYKEQMTYYKRALEQITNKRVKETVIYSTSISKEISM